MIREETLAKTRQSKKTMKPFFNRRPLIH